jgi:hypothetical protein
MPIDACSKAVANCCSACRNRADPRIAMARTMIAGSENSRHSSTICAIG